MNSWILRIVALFAALAPAASSRSEDTAPAPDLSKQPTLYVVGYAHLDTQWRWTYAQTIREYLANTLHDNFKLIESHPEYVFNFTGSRRYQMFKEYFPAEYEKLKTYVTAGRWFPCGSSVDENDTNTPSAESLIRNVMYGNRWFRRELGVASSEYMLPDCFGFTAAVPSVLAHCGIKGFSTQKLTWGSVVGIPFKVGVWEGPDGHGVIAALDPGTYDGDIEENLANSEKWRERIEANGKQSGVFADFHYYGTGDVGGAPKESSVAMLEQSLSTKGSVHVVGGRADQLFEAITPEMKKRLPHYKGELELTEHSAGSLTSQAAMKRWNRKNELLADAAERASVLAWWLGARAYPAQKLEDAWTLVLGSQMHDIVSGTALARGYEYAWNDELVAANQFGGVLQDAVEVIAGRMNTRADGTALVLFNPLSIEREDVVEAEIPGDAKGAGGVRVTGPDGKPVLAQVLHAGATGVRIAFLAKVPSVGFAVYDARLTPIDDAARSALRVEEKRLENERWVVTLNDDGDVASIRDKKANREILSGPARLGLHYENPREWPAWNQDWADRQLPPKEFVGGPARVRIVERGPVRIAVEVSRESGASTFVQTIRLAAGGAGDRVEFDNDIAWATRERSLRAAFPLTAKNATATYDCQTGTVERGNAHEKQFEYGFQQWFDLTDSKGDYGVTVMSDSKYGSDKPDDGTLRLTLLHTPGTRGGYPDQGSQDLGRHRILYALEGHAGDWRQGRSAQEAERLNQPILAFRATPHDGPLGKSFALVKTSDDDVRISALKKAEDSDEVIVRLRELSGRDKKGVHVSAAKPIASAREVDGQERDIAKAEVRAGELVTDVRGFELRAFAIKLGAPTARATEPRSTPLDLPFDIDVVSSNANRSDGAMDADGRTFPAEQLPATLAVGGTLFRLGGTVDGAKNAVTCRGQEIALPAGAGDDDRLDVLVASDGDRPVSFAVDGKPISIRVRDWKGFIGQWDRRLWPGEDSNPDSAGSNGLAGIEPGFVNPEPIAWFSSHLHGPGGDAFYEYCYLYTITIDLPKGAKTIRLPNDERVKVLAASAVRCGADRVVAAAPLFDTMEDHVQDAPRIVPSAGSFKDVVRVSVEPRLYWRDDAIRCTLDGSEPTPSSPAYHGSFFLDRPATIKATVIDGRGRPGPLASARIEVKDVTPPSVERVTPTYASAVLRVKFSEPVDDSALRAANYALDPPIEVKSARKGEDDGTVILELLSAPELQRTYHLKIAGVKDASPAHNSIASTTIDVVAKGPVFTLERVSREQFGSDIRDIADLPVKAADAWTLNLFVRIGKEIEDRTLIAGFGKCEQATAGGARYLAKFSSGVHLWSHNRDVRSQTPLDVGRWQMLTATYDGHVLRLFKDAKPIGERNVTLADDENSIHIAPLDPWDGKRRFDGEIRGLTIWSEALTEEAIRSLATASEKR